MTSLSEKDKSLASLALFSSLYDTHRNVKDVLIQFIRMSIMDHGELVVRPVMLKGFLHDDFGFDNLPMAIIESAMRQAPFLSKSKSEKSTYTVKTAGFNKDVDIYKSQVDSAKRDITDVLVALRQHLHQKDFPNTDKISDAHLQRALSTFLIESHHESTLSVLIQQFIILHPEYSSILQKVSNGAIIFMGLSYNPNAKEYTTLKEPLNLYLDTEILFYGAGYDGPTYETFFREFTETITQINNRYYSSHGKRLINLKVFPEIRDEVEAYFAMAEKIITGRAQLEPSRNAMTHLVQSSKTPSDLVRKKAQFWKFIEENGISDEIYSAYYDPINTSYNIESEEFLNALGRGSYQEREDAQKNLRYLNYINILRKNRDQRNFASIGYLFVSQTNQVLQLARIVRKNIAGENVPLSTNLGEITARLWLGLNQGFNPSTTLRSMDVIVKAQIGLSSIINSCIEKKHTSLKSEHDLSSPEYVATELAALKIYVPNHPEDLTDTAEIVHNVNNLEQYVDDKILEVQHKDEIIKAKEEAILDLQSRHTTLLQEQQDENNNLRAILCSKARDEFKNIIERRKLKRYKYITRKNKNTFWSAAWSLIALILSAVISIILFFEDHRTGGSILLTIGVIGILIDRISCKDDIRRWLKNLTLPFSRLSRLSIVKSQLLEFDKCHKLPNFKEFSNTYFKTT